jgi:hypothetical protein
VASASTIPTASGTTSLGSFFGSLVPSHGELPTSRSRMAALNTAATSPWLTWTVAGDSTWDSLATQAWTSPGRIADSRRSPKVG